MEGAKKAAGEALAGLYGTGVKGWIFMLGKDK
jgi:hypothetical protein